MIVYVVYESKDFGANITDIKAVVSSPEKADKLLKELEAKNSEVYYDWVDYALDAYSEI